MAAITRDDVAGYIQTLALVYVVLIFIRVMMSWLPRIPYNLTLDKVLTFVREVVDPYLNLFRRFVPLVRVGPGGVDLSPIVATIVLIAVATIVASIIRGG